MAQIGGMKTPVPQPVSLFVIRLSTTMKSLRLYPMHSEIPRRNAQDAVEALREAIGNDPYLEIRIARDSLHYGDASVFPHSESFLKFAREFYKRNLAAVRFQGSATPEEIMKFLLLAIMPAEELASQGGMELVLSQQGVINVNVSEAATRVVETAAPTDPRLTLDEDEAQAAHEILATPVFEQSRDNRVLMRFAGDPIAIADFLTRGARAALASGREGVIEEMAEALLALELVERGKFYRTYLLPRVRWDDISQELAAHLGREEILNALGAQLDSSDDSVAGTAAALRSLSDYGVPGSSRTLDEVLSAFRALEGDTVLLERVASAAEPVCIRDVEQVRASAAPPTRIVTEFAGMDENGELLLVGEDVLEPIRDEALRGTSDGDIIKTLTQIAILEQRPGQFEAVITQVENSVGFLVDSGETEVAADVSELLARAMGDPQTPERIRARMASVIASITQPMSLPHVAATLRRHRTDSAEYAACKRLLSVLGATAIDPLLEILAQEQDMSARKALIELISISAVDYIPELGQRLGDKRWYLVRNVVTILGNTRSPEALPFLQRTLRHYEPRVRRETIRSLAMIRQVASEQMIAAALTDEDAQTVQLAVRTLASLKTQEAASALETVAQGLGRGNREPAVRIEALAALGRIGAPSSGAVLTEIASKRTLFAGGKDRELKEAASQALGAWRMSSRTGGVQS